ncbi:MAG: sigma factor-like helix-turn-helix DNA-binding protein, partial [Ginsengibacter sp.]
ILQSGLQQLSPQKRRAFQLCKLESKTYKEAAEEMHISKHTVKEYLQDSMAFLKTYVATHNEIICGVGACHLLFYFY